MAYSGEMNVYQFKLPNQAGRITVATTGIDIGGDSSADVATMIVPVPLMIFAFGVVCEETLGTVTGSLFLERSTVILGTDTTVAELDFQSTDLKSGPANQDIAQATALTASTDIAGGDVVYWAPASATVPFPVLITAPQVLTVRHVNTTSVGEIAPFILCRWQGIDARPTSIWTNVN